MNDIEADKLANKIVNAILDKGIGKSTWADLYPQAAKELAAYRSDMVSQIQPIIKKWGVK